MGTIYSVACRDCNVVRDLGKFYAMESITTRAEALALAQELQTPGYSFAAALLVSFMWEHTGHSCTVYNEHNDRLEDEFDTLYGTAKEDTDYWSIE